MVILGRRHSEKLMTLLLASQAVLPLFIFASPIARLLRHTVYARVWTDRRIAKFGRMLWIA
jgi:hypothetical protein